MLSEFRDRLVAGNAEQLIFEKMLDYFKQKGLVKAGGRQRTDATHVLAAVRALNRVVLVAETLRATLNVLALVVPEWLKNSTPVEWFNRYARKFEEYRLPKEKTKRSTLVETIGGDGNLLLQAIVVSKEISWLWQVPAVELLRQVWLQQFEWQEAKLKFRADDNIPPPAKMICLPYDPEASYGRKRATWWVGYKVHLTESCEEDSPHLITNVETSRAGNGDVDVTPRIHHSLQQKGLLPGEHLTDTNYAEAKQFLASRRDYGIDLVAPARDSNDWQVKGAGFNASDFEIDWDKQNAKCPAGQESLSWSTALDRYQNEVIKIKFSMKQCKRCELRSKCTRGVRRTISIRTKENYLVLQQARARQKQSEFREKYRPRAGIEGTISQGVSHFDLRQARYRGMAKTHLQHVISATGLNILRYLNWQDGFPIAKTRLSHFAALAA